MLSAVVTCLNLAIVYPSWMSNIYDYPDISGKWWLYLSLYLNFYASQIVPTIENCRIWLISYDLHYLQSSKNQQWKTEIDVSYAEKDWYLRNRGIWGNQKYVVRVGFTYWLITGVAYNVLASLQNDLLFAVPAIWMFVNIGVPLYLYMKTPRKLQDQFLFQVLMI